MTEGVEKKLESILRVALDLNNHVLRGNEAKSLDSIESLLSKLLQEIKDERESAFKRHLDDMNHKQKVEALLRDLVQR